MGSHSAAEDPDVELTGEVELADGTMSDTLYDVTPAPVSVDNPIVSTSQLTPDGILGYSKGITGGITAGAAVIATAIADGKLTVIELLGAIVAAVAGFVAVWAPANRVKPTPPETVPPVEDVE